MMLSECNVSSSVSSKYAKENNVLKYFAYEKYDTNNQEHD